MSLTMTVMDLMNSDMCLSKKARLMSEKFGCPGTNYPCMKPYADGKAICEGCWINFFNVQISANDARNSERSD